jgi:16S rRNA (guanine527-N7)-methyltransferase
VDQALQELLVTGAAGMGVALDDKAVMCFSAYMTLLQQWGKKINLTTRLDSEEIIVYHFLDSLAGVPIVASFPHGRMVDLGSGAGLPSLPLKFALPGLNLVLIDSIRKKVAFCQAVVRSVGAAGVSVIWGRGEDFGSRPEHSRGYDWAVSRALGRSADVAGMALPFLAPGGSLILYKGDPESAELEDLDIFCKRLGALWRLQPVLVPHLKGVRSLILINFPGQA